MLFGGNPILNNHINIALLFSLDHGASTHSCLMSTIHPTPNIYIYKMMDFTYGVLAVASSNAWEGQVLFTICPIVHELYVWTWINVGSIGHVVNQKLRSIQIIQLQHIF